jgi:hypothetical protein
LNWDFGRLTGWAGFFSVIDSAEFQASCAEVEEEAHFQARNFDVVDGLGEVDVVQGGNGFDFDGDSIVHEKINPAGAQLLVFVENLHFVFALEMDALKLEFVKQRPLVDHFQEAGAEGAVDFHGAADDFLGGFGVFEGFVGDGEAPFGFELGAGLNWDFWDLKDGLDSCLGRIP